MKPTTVRNLYDREGHTETEIISKKEIISITEKWLIENDFKTLMKEEGIYRTSQSYGNRVEVCIDTRNGKMFCRTREQNNMCPAEPFFITLISMEQVEKDSYDICEGVNMTVVATAKEITEATELKNSVDELELEKLVNGKYKISWWDNREYITAESFVEKLMKEKWNEWIDNYTDYILDGFEEQEQYPTWRESIIEYYNELL